MTNTPAQLTPDQLTPDQIYAATHQWFTGKALSNALIALTRLNLAAARGYWLPEDKSRSISAALNKVSTAVRNRAKRMEEVFRNVFYFSHPLNYQAFLAHHNVYFGIFTDVGKVDYDALLAASPNISVTLDIKYAQSYAAAFAPVVAVIKALDATRPPPVFTSLGVSPTLTRTLKDLGLFVDSTDLKVSLCPQRVEWIERTKWVDSDARPHIVTVRIPVLVTEWPKHALLGVSRHAHDGFNAFSQCHACGHGIKNAFNWVPLLVETAGRTYGLWVGRDCSKSLFGIKMTGDFVRSVADAGGVE